MASRSLTPPEIPLLLPRPDAVPLVNVILRVVRFDVMRAEEEGERGGGEELLRVGVG